MSGAIPLFPACPRATLRGELYLKYRIHYHKEIHLSIIFPLQFFTAQLKHTHDAEVTSPHPLASVTKAIGHFYTYII
jgi:hypothetical protein